MLRHLSIRNIVLVSSCDIEFADGLCVLTGETGAGKSILLDALGLLIGARADSGLIRQGENSASVTAEFDISRNAAVRSLLEELGIDQSETLLIRRTLQTDGKSRCFINDQVVSLSALKQMGDGLVEVHSQHDQKGLLDPTSQRELLDRYGKLDSLCADTSYAYRAWKDAARKLETLQQQIQQAARERDYLEHMRSELEALAPTAGEEETLSTLRSRMMQSEKLKDALQSVFDTLEGDETIHYRLQQAQRQLTRLPDSFSCEPVIEALDRAQIEIQDAIDHLRQMMGDADYDPSKLEEVEERLFALKGAARKYHCSVDELPSMVKDVTAKLDALDNQHFAQRDLEKQVDETYTHYKTTAEALSQARTKTAKKLQQQLVKELVPLKMGQTKFKVVQELLPESQWAEHGMEHVCFEVATNTGQELAPLHKVASGGELSRFMLALKVVLSPVNAIRTYIFDEIDTGTGGAIADAIGARLALLAEQHQVLVVTHLPQVAARGNHHLFISKEVYKNQTFTHVNLLDANERKEELARMLAGADVTDEARGAAGRLIQMAG